MGVFRGMDAEDKRAMDGLERPPEVKLTSEARFQSNRLRTTMLVLEKSKDNSQNQILRYHPIAYKSTPVPYLH